MITLTRIRRYGIEAVVNKSENEQVGTTLDSQQSKAKVEKIIGEDKHGTEPIVEKKQAYSHEEKHTTLLSLRELM